MNIGSTCSQTSGPGPRRIRHSMPACAGGHILPGDAIVARAGNMSLLDDFVNDVKYGIRIQRRSPMFAGVVLATLAIAIGATVTVFSIVDAWLIRPRDAVSFVAGGVLLLMVTASESACRGVRGRSPSDKTTTHLINL